MPTRAHRHRPHRGAAARDDRRADLLDAAVTCIRREGPNVSMEQIAAESGVTKPVLYRFFRDKGELCSAIAERYVEVVGAELRSALGTDSAPRSLLEAGIDSYLSLIEREPQIYRFLMQRARREQAAGDTIDDFIRRLGSEIGALLGEQLAATGNDTGGAEVWGQAIVGMVNATADWWIDRQTMSRRRVVGYLADLVWNGLSSLPVTRSTER